MILFDVPDELLKVQGPVSWIPQLLPLLEKSSRDKMANLEQFLSFTLESMTSGMFKENGISAEDAEGKSRTDVEMDDELLNDSLNINFSTLARKLTRVAFLTYLRKFDSARQHLRSAQRRKLVLSDNQEGYVEGNYLKVVKYMYDAAEWAIDFLQRHRQAIEQNNNISETLDSLYSSHTVDSLTKRWYDEVQCNKQCRATISFMKGSIGNFLGIQEIAVLSFFEQAVELDPEFHVWYHHAYRRARIIRRAYRSVDELPSPGETEKLYCEKALELSPREISSMINYAVFLKESVWTRPKCDWDEKEKEVKESVTLFAEALRIAEEEKTRCRKKWLREIKIHLAELLVFGKADLDQEWGKILFEESKEEFPNSSFVLHKVAKLYHRGAFFSSNFKDRGGAEKFYLKALNYGDSTNYPCLKDYLKLLRSERRYDDMIKIIDVFLESCVRDDHVAKLLVEKGCIQLCMIDDPESPSTSIISHVCEEWVGTFSKFSELSGEAFKVILRYLESKGACSSTVPFPTQKIIQNLEQMKFSNKKEEVRAVRCLLDNFAKVLNTPDRDCDWRSQALFPSVQHYSVPPKHTSSNPIPMRNMDQVGNYARSWVPPAPWRSQSVGRERARSRSEADSDNNWRR